MKTARVLVLVLLPLGFRLSGAASRDTSAMSLVPGGVFTLPFHRDTAAVTVTVSPFYLDVHAVTAAEYSAFLQRHPRFQPAHIGRLLAEQTYLRAWKSGLPPQALKSPVTDISWYAAKAYCADQGKRLPTTAEWEWAAKPLPLGMDSAAFLQAVIDWYGTPMRTPPPAVGSGTRNLYGIEDLFGVIWEWTSDFNAFGFTGLNDQSAESRGLFCGAGTTNAAGFANYATYMRWAFRLSLQPDYTEESLGFRCARNAAANGG